MAWRHIGRAGLTAVAGALGAWSTSASAGWNLLNMTEGVTPISREVYDLHMLILWVCVIIGIVVFGAMFIAMAVHRKSLGAKPAKFHHSTFAEIAWTVVPVLILVGMAWPATKTLIKMEDSSASDITVKVTGYQWMWRYDYIEDGVTFYSNLASSSRAAIYTEGGPQETENYLLDVDKRMVLPVGKKVRFLLTADDVIHAWWVPDLGQKKDAIPGFINEIWARIEKTGVYRGQCAELCGKDHGFMPIVVEARSQAGYEEWVAEQLAAQAEEQALAGTELSHDQLMARGERIYMASCASCHQIDGEGVPEVFPAIKGNPVVRGDVKKHLQVVLDGRKGTAMRAFGTTMSDVELAAVVTYQRNAFGNETGDIVQPSEIATARQLDIGG